MLRVLASAVILVAGCREEARAPALPLDLQDRSDAIARDVAALRQLAQKSPIPAKRQTAAEFAAYMSRASQTALARNPHESTALTLLGLLPEAVDLAESTATAMTTQAAAYYDPAAKTFYVLSSDNLDLLIAHELTHGLQDQHFDLQRYVEGTAEQPLDGDAQLARRFVVEGDAMLAMLAYGVYAQTKQLELPATATHAFRRELEKLAKASPEMQIAQMQAQIATVATQSPELAKASAALLTLPRVVIVPILQSYTLAGSSPSTPGNAAGGRP